MTITFSFAAPTGHDIDIEWYHDDVLVVDGTFDGVVVSGATTEVLTITNPTSAWNGVYFARVIDHTADCTVDSDPVVVTVPATCDLAITVQPVDVNTTAGNDIELTVSYTGEHGTVTFQWYKDGLELEDGAQAIGTVSGALTDTLTIASATEDAEGSYTVILVDDGIADCSVVSDAATVSVAADCDLLITSQPESQAVLDGGTLELTFAYTGSGGPFTIQWFLDDVPLADGASGGSTISGATTETLTITGWTPALAGAYYAVVTDTATVGCVAQTNAALVTENQCDVAIASQPEPFGYEAGGLVELSVVVTGGVGPFTYQWYHDGVALVDGFDGSATVAGATTANLSISNTTATYAGDYKVIITDTGVPECSIESDTVNVFMLLLIENFEGGECPTSTFPPCIFDIEGWHIATSVGGSYTGNTTTPLCGTCSLRMVGGTPGQETDIKHDVASPQMEAWVHVRVRVNSLPTTDTPVLRLGVTSDTLPSEGDLRVVLRTAANGQVVQITSPGAADAETVAQYSAGVAYHIWAYYNANTGEGWVKFGTTSEEPEAGDNMASYTGGSTSAIDYLFLQTVDDKIYDFDTVRWANYVIGDIDC